MNERALFPGSKNGQPLADHAEHLRQLCLFRRHVSALIEAHEPRTPVWHSLCHFRDALDRYQSIYTGDIDHFKLGQDQTSVVRGIAND